MQISLKAVLVVVALVAIDLALLREVALVVAGPLVLAVPSATAGWLLMRAACRLEASAFSVLTIPVALVAGILMVFAVVAFALGLAAHVVTMLVWMAHVSA